MVENRTTIVVVCDAGPLIHLDELECIHLLSDFPRVLVPEEVWKEVEHHRPAALTKRHSGFEKTTLASPPSPVLKTLVKLYSLHGGEQSAIRIAQMYVPSLLLTDDNAARLAAQSLGLSVHGTIGLLIRSIRRKQMTKARVIRLLQTIDSVSTLHIKPALLHDIIREIEQRD
ncbi:MAG: DNA-binding protein [Planctomycetaceae bacterium]|nr:DNA-binding protein [Planctomycetaceae bacterium]